MTVMDPQHAAELVTFKGKVYKFDAIECMVNYLKNQEYSDFAHLLVHDYFKPSEWVDVNTCTFIISEAIPSPMGAYLSALSTLEKAEELQMTKGGQLFEWSELREKIVKNE